MSGFSTHSKIHNRISQFVKWITPEEDTEKTIDKQADEIRGRIKDKAEEDGLTVLSMPYSGSYAKNDGIRRHFRGNSQVEGQDVDIAFIIKRKDKDGKEITELIYRFEGYAKKSYPKTTITTAKSSVEMDFSATKLNYDIVPLLETDVTDRQELIRRDTGERRKTSIIKHIEFVKKRTNASNELKGVVKFNDCLRLVKWWRYFQQENSGVFGNGDNDKKVPSFLLNLLCAKAYDERKVQTTWAQTMADWFGFIANTVRNRKPVVFADYVANPQIDSTALWVVADPVDPTNNIVKSWQEYQINELAKWFEEARDTMIRAISRNTDGDDAGSLEYLVELFGNPFKQNCE